MNRGRNPDAVVSKFLAVDCEMVCDAGGRAPAAPAALYITQFVDVCAWLALRWVWERTTGRRSRKCASSTSTATSCTTVM